MKSAKYIARKDVPAWLAELAAAARVFVPERQGKAVVYRPFTSDSAVEWNQRPTESAKHVVFPRSEELMSFKRAKDPEGGANVKISLQEPSALKDSGQSIIFGALSCDARGFLTFDPVYAGSGTQGKAPDPYYLERRAKTTVIVRSCRTPLNTCFCHWVGGGPASPEGADILATDVEDGLVLTPLTEKGEGLLGSAKLAEAGAEREKAAEASRHKAEGLMGEKADVSKAPAALLALFDNKDFWQDESARCLSCGACTYLCPTCYCFNITDETNGLDGVRLRSWDACMLPLFTLEASGHNPRPNKAARLRNRVGHKFSYYPGLHQGRFSCCGCGRCIKSCPSSVDIRRIVLDAVKEAK